MQQNDRAVLLLEDEDSIAEEITRVLRDSGYDVERVLTCADALKRAAAKAYRVLVIDRMLPDGEGLAVLKELRRLQVLTPALILSALDETHQKIEGLDGGADDYMGKPFDPDEMRARLAVLARRALPHPEVILVGDLEIWSKAQRAYRDGIDLHLSPKEFQLLHYLAQNAGIVVTKSMIRRHVFGLRYDPETNVIDVHIKRLRDKLEAGFERKLLRTERGKGYVLADGT